MMPSCSTSDVLETTAGKSSAMIVAVTVMPSRSNRVLSRLLVDCDILDGAATELGKKEEERRK